MDMTNIIGSFCDYAKAAKNRYDTKNCNTQYKSTGRRDLGGRKKDKDLTYSVTSKYDQRCNMLVVHFYLSRLNLSLKKESVY
jgi:hypothetical protein